MVDAVELHQRRRRVHHLVVCEYGVSINFEFAHWVRSNDVLIAAMNVVSLNFLLYQCSYLWITWAHTHSMLRCSGQAWFSKPDLHVSYLWVAVWCFLIQIPYQNIISEPSVQIRNLWISLIRKQPQMALHVTSHDNNADWLMQLNPINQSSIYRSYLNQFGWRWLEIENIQNGVKHKHFQDNGNPSYLRRTEFWTKIFFKKCFTQITVSLAKQDFQYFTLCSPFQFQLIFCTCNCL